MSSACIVSNLVIFATESHSLRSVLTFSKPSASHEHTQQIVASIITKIRERRGSSKSTT